MAQLIGQTIGQYQILEFVARGDTSLVYKGFQASMSRYVAVKLLSPALAKQEPAARAFQRAAEIAAQLEHENILPVYDYGQQDGISYLVTRFVDEGTLQDSGYQDLSPQEALDILRPIADAVEYAHSLGIVHGNLKASNVLMDARGKPLLTDFGFADLASRGAEPTAYLSPEQLSGNDIDHRTDVYGLGMLLYEMLVEELPPAGTLPTPRLKRPDLTPALEKVILKAMASAPNLRYQTVSDFIRALEDAVMPVPLPTAAPAPMGATVDELTETPAKPAPAEAAPDRSWLVFLLGGIFVILLAFVIVNVLAGGDSGATEPPALVPTDVPGEAPPVVQPTTPPQVEPTEEPQPTEEPPPTEDTEPPPDSTEVAPPEQPDNPDAGEGEGSDIIAGICGSAGASAGILVLGAVFVSRQRHARKP